MGISGNIDNMIESAISMENDKRVREDMKKL